MAVLMTDAEYAEYNRLWQAWVRRMRELERRAK